MIFAILITLAIGLTIGFVVGTFVGAVVIAMRLGIASEGDGRRDMRGVPCT